MAKTNTKKRTTNSKSRNHRATPDKAIEKIEGAIKHKEIEIAKAEKAIKKWEDFEERIELKELFQSIREIEEIIQNPCQQLNDLANHLIKKFKSEVGLASTKSRKNRFQNLFEVALWGKGPSVTEGENIKKHLGHDVNSSVYKIFSDARIGNLTNREVFNSAGIKSESAVRRAILDWELAVEKYEGLSDGARSIMKVEIAKLIHGEDVHFKKSVEKYDSIPQYVMFYDHSSKVSEELKKYCVTMQKNANQLSSAYNDFSKKIIGYWNAISVDESTYINNDSKLSNKLWIEVQKMIKQIKK